MPRDGRVDNGSELFGNLTPQPAFAHPNGFAALAVWDQPAHGGNGDGIIDAADAIWPRLRLWQDADHDGKVQPGELHTLAAVGTTGISVHYRKAGGADRYGNRYGYAAPAFGTGHAAALAYDFFLTTAAAGPASPPGNSWPLPAGAAAAGAAALAGAALAIGRRRRAHLRPGPRNHRPGRRTRPEYPRPPRPLSRGARPRGHPTPRARPRRRREELAP